MVPEWISPWLIWFLAGAVLMVLELQLPGFIVFFFGVGCWVVAVLLQLLDLTLNQQILAFILTSLFCLLALRRFAVKVFRGSSQSVEDIHYDDLPKGVHVQVTDDISPIRNGRVHFRGTTWEAAADQHILAGDTVEIIDYAQGTRLVFWVQKISSSNMEDV